MIYLITSFLALILSLSLLKEFPKISKILDHFPVLMTFIPTWSFFAPTPGMTDYHLLVRGIDEYEQVEDWQEALPIKDRSILAFLWNPNKKNFKTIMDMTQELIRFSIETNDEKQICLSIPYLHLLNYVSSIKRNHQIKKIQFMILGSSRLIDYKVEFVSSVHLTPTN